MEKAFWLGLWLGLGLWRIQGIYLEGFENMKFFILTSHTYILLFLDAQTNAHFMQLTP